MPSTNIEKIRKWRRDWYDKNKELQLSRQATRRVELARWLLELKKTLSCADCQMAFTERPECCDFHHIDPSQKDADVSKLIRYSLKSLKAEIAKCVALCANCHRTRHALSDLLSLAQRN